MTATCTVLTPRTHIDFDEQTLVALCARHGDAAEAHLADLLSQVETLLRLAQSQAEQDHPRGLGRTCEDLLPLARTIGMRSLELAAIGVIDGLASGDPVALAACTRRLMAMGQPDTFHDWTTVQTGSTA
ncbi:MAG: hypothetical protein AAF264_05790 [Pseudomonadota bacterium]